MQTSILSSQRIRFSQEIFPSTLKVCTLGVTHFPHASVQSTRNEPV